MTTASATLAATADTTAGAGTAAGQPATAGAGAATAGAGAATDGAGAATAARLDWLGEAPDELHEFAQANGYKGPADVVTNVRELQKFLGADKAGRGLILPKDEADADGWGQVWAKLGRPEKAEGYGLATLEGADPKFAGAAAEKFHELGLSEKQAKGLAEWWGKELTANSEAESQSYLEKASTEMAELEAEWGQAAEKNQEIARRGAQAFGFSAEELDKIERALGTKALMGRFLEVGRKLGEDVLPAGAGAGEGRLTPAAAQERIAEKLGDKEFMAKIRAKDPRSQQELDRLYQAAYRG